MEPLYLVVIFGMVVFEFVSLKLGGWLMPFVLGVFGLATAAGSLTVVSDIPLFPWPTLLLALVSVIVIFYAAFKLRGDY